jgi:WD40 repeat protein
MRRAVEMSLGLVMVVGLVWIAWGIGAHAGAMAAGERFERGASWEPRVTHIFDHDFEPGALAFSPDGHHLAVGGGLHRAVMVWDLRNGSLVRRLEDEKGGVSSLAWSRDGRRLVAGRSFTTVERIPSLTAWDTSTWHSAYRTMGPFEPAFGYNDVIELAVAPGGRSLAASYNQGGVGIHDPSTGRLVQVLSADALVGGGIAFSPNGNLLLASAGRSAQTLNVFDVGTGALVHSFTPGLETGQRVSWRPVGEEIASIGFVGGRVTVWNSSTRQVSRVLDDRVERIYALSYSPDGTWLVTVAPGLGIVIREALSDRTAGLIARDRPPFSAVAWSADSRHLATAHSQQARVWDLSDLTSTR